MIDTLPLTRRGLLATAAVGLGTSLLPVRAGLLERLRIGLIGCGVRGVGLLGWLREFPDVDIVHICDVIEPRLDNAMKRLADAKRPQKPTRTIDYRQMLDDSSVDAVIIATTQHWHGLPFIDACAAKKAIYIEKPLAHTIAEGQAMVKAAAKQGVFAMMGFQQRAGEHFIRAVQLVHEGKLGKVGLIECWNYDNPNNGQRTGKNPDEKNVPQGYHWDRWLGPAPLVPFNRSRLDSSWWFAYGGGMLTNWAVHHIDIVLWAMKAKAPMSATCVGGKYVIDDLADAPDTLDAVWRFPDFQLQYSYRGFNAMHRNPRRPINHGIAIHGSKGTLLLDRYGYELWVDPKDEKPLESVGLSRFDPAMRRNGQDIDWLRAFVDAVKAGKQPPATVEDGHLATNCCHLANIAYHTGRTIQWDGKAEVIVNDADAARQLSRNRRKGYELPNI